MHISMNDMRHKVGMPLCMYSTFELLSWCRCHHRFHWILCMCNGQWNNIIVMIIIFMLLRQSNHTYTRSHILNVLNIWIVRSIWINTTYLAHAHTHSQAHLNAIFSSWKCDTFGLISMCDCVAFARMQLRAIKRLTKTATVAAAITPFLWKFIQAAKFCFIQTIWGERTTTEFASVQNTRKEKWKKNEPTNQQNGYIHRVWWSGNVCALLGTTHTNSFGDNVYSIKCDEWFIRRYDSAASHSHIYIKCVPGCKFIHAFFVQFSHLRSRALAGFCVRFCIFVEMDINFAFFWYVPTFSFSSLSSFSFVRVALLSLFFPFVFSFFIFVLCFVLCLCLFVCFGFWFCYCTLNCYSSLSLIFFLLFRCWIGCASASTIQQYG